MDQQSASYKTFPPARKHYTRIILYLPKSGKSDRFCDAMMMSGGRGLDLLGTVLTAHASACLAGIKINGMQCP